MQNYIALSIVIFLAPLFSNGARAQEVNWEDAIVLVEESARKYSDHAFQILGSTWVGPANDSIKFGYFAVCVGGLVSVHLPVAQDVVR
ncbi:hypothetical protein BD293_1001 [Roseinatronobacter monicus]|uniref:Uncharacterized protein n=1 Tax=Roseinatronobacter monicus TaxID=393481 RepID=A0A543KBD6_9RHOB|nr:hypothetical protein BD293_1001 [Roseinatronobacter monicus]